MADMVRQMVGRLLREENTGVEFAIARIGQNRYGRNFQQISLVVLSITRVGCFDVEQKTLCIIM